MVTRRPPPRRLAPARAEAWLPASVLRTRVSPPRGLVRGLTAVEMLITLVIVAVLAVLAGPSFVSLLRSQQVKGAANDLVSAMIFARSEAAKRGSDVVINPASNWAGGWTIAAGTETLRSQPAMSGLQFDTSATRITFNAVGRTAGDSTFTIYDTQRKTYARCVEVRADGLPRSWLERGGDYNCVSD